MVFGGGQKVGLIQEASAGAELYWTSPVIVEDKLSTIFPKTEVQP